MKTVTFAPRGRDPQPANAFTHISHEAWQFVAWQLDAAGWAIGYAIHALQATNSSYQVTQP